MAEASAPKVEASASEVAAVEEKIKALELENAGKDEVISKLEAGVAEAAGTSATATATATATDGASAVAAPAEAPAAVALSEEVAAQGLAVYDDDAALSAKAPSLASLKFHNGDAIEVGKGRPVVVTWFCNLNKGDFVTLVVLSDIYQKYKDQADFVAISRDHNEADTEKWLKKYHNKRMEEQTGPNGEVGMTARCDFQMAFDEGHAVNAAFKTAMKKAVVGVGMAIVIDGEGNIKWYESFVRGKPAANQFDYQLHAVVNGTELLANGKAPEVVEEEMDGEAGTIPDDVDFLAAGTGDY